MYLAITQETAEWILPKVGLVEALARALDILHEQEMLKDGLFSEGSIRISKSKNNEIIVIWNSDYLSGTGDESMGFIKVFGDISLDSQPHFKKESLERSIYLITQRLQGFLIDAAFIHRKQRDDVHTLIAGRGSDARRFSLGYFDSLKDMGSSGKRTMISVGPSDNFNIIIDEVVKESKNLSSLLSVANDVIINAKINPSNNLAELEDLRSEISKFVNEPDQTSSFQTTQINTTSKNISTAEKFKSIGLDYFGWLADNSPLSKNQRQVIVSETLDSYPIRILGPGGSGKTLLMQLLAIKKLYKAKKDDEECRILYIVHSDAMKSKIHQKFEILCSGNDFTKGSARIEIITLVDYCLEQLDLSLDAILSSDADDAKKFQISQLLEALEFLKTKRADTISSSSLLSTVYSSGDLLNIFANLVLSEISISIKGHGLESDKRRYVESEKSLSRLHGILDNKEREFIFEIFENYHREVFDQYGALDPDDLAISLYGSLKTPVWRLRRRTNGFDYIFVDEAQLFNENERKIFSLLSKTSIGNTPIALALDEAQSFYGQSSAGFSALGIENITNKTLDSIHRSSLDIIKLAFFIIQRSTNLFTPDFPDFTQQDSFMDVGSSESRTSFKPKIEREAHDSLNFNKFIVRRIRSLRRENIRQIAVVCHSESFWGGLEDELSKTDLPFQVLRERGEKIKTDQPHVILSRPAQIGGQEFDAVIIVGLDQSSSYSKDNPALSSAIEQQMIRETYLSVTRAKHRVIFAIGKHASVNDLVQDAIEANLITLD